MSGHYQPPAEAAQVAAKNAAEAAANVRSADHATIKITGPDGTAYIQSVNPDKVEIGAINIGDGSGVQIHTQGSAEIGELNVGLSAVLGRNLNETLESDNGAVAIVTIAAILIVFSLIGVLAWRALSGRSNQRH
jgi:hypothetical protein